MKEVFPEQYDAAYWDNFPPNDPEGGKLLNRFGIKLYERTPFDAGGKAYLFKDVPDAELLKAIGGQTVEWNGKLALVCELHPDLKTAVEMAVDKPRITKWSNEWWVLRRRDRKVAEANVA